MAEDRNCSECAFEHECSNIYKKTGEYKGPSIAFKVTAVFLLPIAVFIIGISISEHILSGILKSENTITALSFLAGVFTALLSALLTRCYYKNKSRSE